MSEAGPVNWNIDIELMVTLDAYSRAELERLAEKQSIMKAGHWSPAAEASDARWRRDNRAILLAAEERVFNAR